MIKFLGALLVIGSCFSIAQNITKDKQKQLTAIKELYNLLINLSREIHFRLEPLPKLINRLTQDEDSVSFSFLKQLNQNIEKDRHSPFREHWQETLSHFAQENHLPHSATSLMRALGEHLGETDFETETTRLQDAAENLYSLYSSLDKENKKTEKLTRSLGVLSGISIVILLL